MSDPLEEFKTALQAGVYSLTSTRQLVFSVLQDKEPQTMAEIVAACQGRVDRSSVYRTISLFERLGIVQRLQIGWKYKLELSDRYHHHHHHLTCLNCGRTFALPADHDLERRLKLLATGQNFEMSGHQLEIQGLCKNCL